LYFSPVSIRIINSKWIIWAGNVAHMRENRNAGNLKRRNNFEEMGGDKGIR
jgi:hypothetical protein